MVIGLPVYLHYCGGELEKVNVLIKGTSCCGEDEDESAMDAGCCKDEQVVLKSNVDFTFAQINPNHFIKSVQDVFYSASNPFLLSVPKAITLVKPDSEFPPPKLFQKQIIATSVLRI